jgi:division protein CdvB (Snf7/Vps24/ESCRT-III family)
LLTAIEQMQSVMVAQPTPHRNDLVKRQLRELLDEIGNAQCELDELLLATKSRRLPN